MKTLIVAGLLTLLLAATAIGQQITLIQNGQSNYKIVLGQDASPSEKHAADELQMFLQQISGATLPIVSDGGRLADNEIILGDNQHLRALDTKIDFAKLGKEGFTIRTVGRNLVIAGGKLRGTMYGVYTFLEDYLDCRWFSAKVSRIPKKTTVAIQPIDDTQVPRLEYREPFEKDGFDGDWSARNKANSNAAALDEKRGGKISYFGFVHTFNDLVPPAKYYAQHPEYFSLIDGQRMNGYYQLCLTNPDVLQIVIAEVKKRMREHPEATVFSVSQNDAGGACQCPNCQAIVKREGSEAGPLIEFVNKVADAVKDEFPDKVIDTLAYQYTRKPPLHVRPRPNVIVRLCSIECCFGHPLETCDSPANKAFRDDIVGWSKLTKRIWVWDYVTDFPHYIQPFPNLNVLKPNIQFFANNGVSGVFEEGNYTSLGGEFEELREYMMAKFLWNPDYDQDRAMNEFLAGFYGSAAPFIRQYIDLIHNDVVKRNIHTYIWDGPNAPYLNPENIAQANQLFDQAEKAVANDPDALLRVKTARLPISYVMLVNYKPKGDGSFAIRGDRYGPEPDAAAEALVRNFGTVCKQANITAMDEGGSPPQKFVDDRLAQVAGHPVTYLDNGAVKVAVTPDFGGRIVGLWTKGKDANLIYNADPNASGYGQWWRDNRNGPGWITPLTAKLEGTKLTLTGNVEDGVALTRTISLAPEGAKIEVSSTLTNNRKDAIPNSLRTRLALALGNPDDVTLVPGTLSGALATVPVRLAVPPDRCQGAAPLTKADLSGGVVLANHKLGLGVRYTTAAASLSGGGLKSNTQTGDIDLRELLDGGTLAPGASANVSDAIEVLTDLSTVAQAPLKEGMATDGKHTAGRVEMSPDEFSYYREGELSKLILDPTASSGFSGWMGGNHHEWAIQWSFVPGMFDKGATYDFYAVVRIKKLGNDGGAFTAGVYDTVRGKGWGGGAMNAADMEDGKWYTVKIGTCVPEAGMYLWAAPTNNPKNVAEVCVDHFYGVKVK
jgi:hypothetical protein